MKTVLATLFVIVTFAPAAPAQSPRASLESRCPVKLPTQREVSTVLGMANFSQTYAARERLMLLAQRICRRGGAGLRVITDYGGSRAKRELRELTATR